MPTPPLPDVMQIMRPRVGLGPSTEDGWERTNSAGGGDVERGLDDGIMMDVGLLVVTLTLTLTLTLINFVTAAALLLRRAVEDDLTDFGA